MDKTVINPKKRSKGKKKQPLKVVYITNPIKFKATASEFRALVQELTGQDSDISDTSRFAAAGGGGWEEINAAAEGNVKERGKVGHGTVAGQGGEKGSDLSSYDEDEDAFYDPQMMGFADSNMLWHEDVNLDVFQRLDNAM